MQLLSLEDPVLALFKTWDLCSSYK